MLRLMTMLAGRPVRSFPGVLQLLTLWIARAEQRAALADLDDNMLRDIGLTRRQARAEAEKPFWKA